ncbi:hypothetical protein L596_030562 [Steinernema carpocapsae]|uniref:Uncharacterized protein n=1 Tax=Steinernema carpocapsae TaxID=34508 RepID=A0A4U5LPQ4_STECR|nr:hypothetical protein L596_030562 [Steinernema carpocapsae]
MSKPKPKSPRRPAPAYYPHCLKEATLSLAARIVQAMVTCIPPRHHSRRTCLVCVRDANVRSPVRATV